MTDPSFRPLLHVGYHKTGTTWLQTRLFASDEVGFCTNSFRRDALHVFVYPHAFEFDAAEARAFYQAEWQRCPPGTVPVLSMERFSGTPHAGRYDSAEVARRLRQTFPEGRVLIVVREQEGAILSSYRQYVKNSGPLSLDGYLHPPYESSVIHQFHYDAFRYDRLVALYDDLFGPENVLVLPYEAFRADPVAYMASIVRFAGLDPQPELLERLRPTDRENASLSALTTSLKRRANRLVSRKTAINPAPVVRLSDRGAVAVRTLFYKLDGWLPRGRRIDAAQRERIREVVGDRYAAGNAALAERTGADLGRYGYRMPGPPPPATPPPDTLTFHVVYTPGTVGLLVPFVASLLEHSPFRFRLVANGCSAEERARLAAVAAESPRLEFVEMPGPLRPHSEGLDWLFARSKEPYFAFMDSDILAVAPFGDAVLAAMAEGPTFFACAQPWASYHDRSTAPDQPLMGRHLSAAGRRVGTTFFAVYERARVERVRAAHGVGFGKYRWEDLPRAVRGRFAETDYRYTIYDTAKTLNLLLEAEGVALRHDPLPSLVHLGGVSGRATVASQRRATRRRLRWRPWTWPGVAARYAVAQLLGAPRARRSGFFARRALAWGYLGEAIPVLQAGLPLPPVPDFGDAVVQHEMDRVVEKLAAFYDGARRCVPAEEPAEVLSGA